MPTGLINFLHPQNRLNRSILTNQVTDLAIETSLKLTKPALGLKQVKALKSTQIAARKHVFEIRLAASTERIANDRSLDCFLERIPEKGKKRIIYAAQTPRSMQEYLKKRLDLPVFVLDGEPPADRLKDLIIMYDQLNSEKRKLSQQEELKQAKVSGVLLGAHGNGYGENWSLYEYRKGVLGWIASKIPQWVSHKKQVKVTEMIKQHPELGKNPLIQTCSDAVGTFGLNFYTGKILAEDGKTEKLLNRDEVNSTYLEGRSKTLDEVLEENGYWIDEQNRIFPQTKR